MLSDTISASMARRNFAREEYQGGPFWGTAGYFTTPLEEVVCLRAKSWARAYLFVVGLLAERGQEVR